MRLFIIVSILLVPALAMGASYRACDNFGDGPYRNFNQFQCSTSLAKNADAQTVADYCGFCQEQYTPPVTPAGFKKGGKTGVLNYPYWETTYNVIPDPSYTLENEQAKKIEQCDAALAATIPTSFTSTAISPDYVYEVGKNLSAADFKADLATTIGLGEDVPFTIKDKSDKDKRKSIIHNNGQLKKVAEDGLAILQPIIAKQNEKQNAVIDCTDIPCVQDIICISRPAPGPTPPTP